MRLTRWTLAGALVLGSLALAAPAGAKADVDPPNSDGYPSTCVFDHEWGVNNGRDLYISADPAYDPDGGSYPMGCSYSVAVKCRNTTTGAVSYTAWMGWYVTSGYGPGTETGDYAVFFVNICPVGWKVNEYFIREESIYGGPSLGKRAFSSKGGTCGLPALWGWELPMAAGGCFT